MQSIASLQTINYKPAKIHKFWLAFVFLWLVLIQVTVSHASKHVLDSSNTCLICIYHANLGTATLNTASPSIDIAQNTPNHFITFISFNPFSYIELTSRSPPYIH